MANHGQVVVKVDAGNPVGALEVWRHSVGHGGINTHPLPDRVIAGLKTLKPRLVRIFLQEFFRVYPEPGRFDWSRLDPYMDSFARTGAKVVAALCIKPQPLFPHIDQAAWMPTNVAEWQHVVRELVRRYSVERRIVTHWEIGNETDIGESGGCPYLIPEPAAYSTYYDMTVEAALKAFPKAKVGGPAACWITNEPLPGLIRHCAQTGRRLDFVSWHHYGDDPANHAEGVRKAKALLDGFPGKRPEMLVTEWSKGFEEISVEEEAYRPRRAAIIAASVLEMMDAGLDWSFYYHAWDQVFYPEQFAPFFSAGGVANMVRHWNERPHRFGLFGVEPSGVRPQYFVFQMLSRMGEERLPVESEDAGLRVLAARSSSAVSALLVNLGGPDNTDRIVTLRFRNLVPGPRRLLVYRIDDDRRWSSEKLELAPIEDRPTYTPESFECQVLCPADQVALVVLRPE